MSAHENIFDVNFFKNVDQRIENCRQYFLNVDGKMVSKMKQINVNADWKNVNARKYFCGQLFFKLSASENECRQLFCLNDIKKWEVAFE